MWGERIDASNIVQTIFPRLAAVAESLWFCLSPADLLSPSCPSANPSSVMSGIRRECLAACSQQHASCCDLAVNLESHGNEVIYGAGRRPPRPSSRRPRLRHARDSRWQADALPCSCAASWRVPAPCPCMSSSCLVPPPRLCLAALPPAAGACASRRLRAHGCAPQEFRCLLNRRGVAAAPLDNSAAGQGPPGLTCVVALRSAQSCLHPVPCCRTNPRRFPLGTRLSAPCARAQHPDTVAQAADPVFGLN
jgi:hypothetical protein